DPEHLDRDVGADLERTQVDLQVGCERVGAPGRALGRPLEDAAEVCAQRITNDGVGMIHVVVAAQLVGLGHAEGCTTSAYDATRWARRNVVDGAAPRSV